MRVAFAHFKEIIFAAGLVFLTTSILAAVTVPSGTGAQQAVSVSVDRANKGDRLPYASRSKTISLKWANATRINLLRSANVVFARCGP